MLVQEDNRDKGPINYNYPKRASTKMIEKGGFGEVLLMGSNYWRSLQKPFISTWKLHNDLNPKVPLKVGTNIDALLRGHER